MNAVLIAQVSSKTDDSKKFDIKRKEDGSIVCSCKTFRLRNKGVPVEQRTCGHLRTFFASQMAKKEGAVIERTEAAKLSGQQKKRKALVDEAYRQYERRRRMEKRGEVMAAAKATEEVIDVTDIAVEVES